jgi:superfamily II DNA/RNA helicase
LISTIERFERHFKLKNVFLSNVNYLVVDEADTFFDSGFGEVIESYVKKILEK